MKPFFAVILPILVVYNAVAFFVMLADKRKAIKGKRRVPERTLFTLAATLAGPGIWAGMYTFRHKTKHLSFVIGIPLITVVEYGLLVFALIRFAV